MTNQRTDAPQTRLRYIAPVGVVALAVVIAVALATVATGPGRSLIPVPLIAQATAAPGAPTLLIRLDVGQESFGPGTHTADYLSDGTVIRWTGAGVICQSEPCGTMERNTLTATGLAALRALLSKDADLLAQPADLKSQILPGKSVLPYGDPVNTFVLQRSDGSRYAVSAPSADSANASNWVPDPGIKRLGSLAQALVDPGTLAGPAGLANPTWAAYQPLKTAIVLQFLVDDVYVPWSTTDSNGITIGSLDGTAVLPDISQTGWPFAGDPDTFGGSFVPDKSEIPALDSLATAYRCAFLPSADALTAIARLPQSVGTSYAASEMAGGTWLSGAMSWNAKSPTTGLSLVASALLPEDVTASCASVLSY
jgi:hypothetical protein